MRRLDQRFGTRDEEEAKSALEARRRQPGEDLRDYAEDVRELTKIARPGWSRVEKSPAEVSTGTGVEDVAGVAGPSASTDSPCQQMADQLGTLKNMLAQWCELGTPRVASEGEGGGPQESVLSSLSPPSATWHEDAILGAAGEERREAAILSSPRRGDAAIFNIAAVMQLRAAIGRCLGENSLL
ncbi:unnamed protein product [Lampetra fluviatilis]